MNVFQLTMKYLTLFNIIMVSVLFIVASFVIVVSLISVFVSMDCSYCKFACFYTFLNCRQIAPTVERVIFFLGEIDFSIF